jgi:ParB family chromosome partitioning protein
MTMTTSAENASAVATEKTAATPAVAPGPEKRRALGRGLDSLLPAGPAQVRENRAGPHEVVLDEVQEQAGTRTRVPAPQVAQPGEAVVQIPLEQIAENPYQTRYFFNEDALEELAESIKANGVVQPIVVRAKEGQYVLVLGERRLRASKLAGKATIPAIVRVMSEQQAAETTVVENLQRQDLNCMEQAAAFAKLSQGFKLTQEQIGNRVGLSRESVSNYMRLLKLPGTVMQYLQEGRLGFSEARVLLRLENPQVLAKVADDAVRKRWSVDQLEEVVFNISVPVQGQEQPEGRARWVDPNVRAAQRELETILGVRVRIRDRKGKGKIVIEYASLEDYDRVVGMLRGKKAG